jgi:hypothetical protein
MKMVTKDEEIRKQKQETTDRHLCTWDQIRDMYCFGIGDHCNDSLRIRSETSHTFRTR